MCINDHTVLMHNYDNKRVCICLQMCITIIMKLLSRSCSCSVASHLSYFVTCPRFVHFYIYQNLPVLFQGWFFALFLCIFTNKLFVLNILHVFVCLVMLTSCAIIGADCYILQVQNFSYSVKCSCNCLQ